MKLKAIALIAVLAGTAATADTKDIQKEIKYLTASTVAIIQKLKIERETYKALAEADGWVADIRQVKDVWCMHADNPKTGQRIAPLVVLDSDRKAGKSCK